MLHSFLDDAVSLEFKRITFNSRNPGLRPSISGSGHAVRLADRSFEVSCNIDRPLLSISTPKTWTIRAPLAGTLFSDADYYDMQATDSDGNIWTSDRVIVPEADFLPADFPLGLLHNVKCRAGYLHLKNSACAHATRLRIECVSESRDNWVHLLNREIEIRMKTGQRFHVAIGFGVRTDVIVIIVRSNESIPAAFECAICEALSFVFDESLDPRFVERIGDQSSDVILSRYTVSDFDSEPILRFHPNCENYFSSVEQLLELYVSYINESEQLSTSFHPSSYLLRLLRHPAYTPIDAQIVTACVVAEAIVQMPRLKAGVKASGDELIGAKQKVESFINGLKVNECAKERLLKSLQRVGEPGVKERFSALVETGLISKEDVSAWVKLRNKYIHLSLGVLSDETNIIDNYRQLLCVRRLIRSMVLACIGYKGDFTDYASIGHPYASYPFKLPGHGD